MPAIQRNLLNRALIDNLPDGDRRGFNDRRISCNRDLFREPTYLKLEVPNRDLTDFQREAADNLWFHSGQTYIDLIDANRQCRELIISCLITERGALDAGRLMFHGDRNARQYGT